MRLLIAEDDRALGLFLSRGLEADGHRVHVAYDGASALEAFRAEMPDLTILDLNMPVLDGERVLQEVRALDADLPVLVLTGRQEVDTRVRCLDRGADDLMATTTMSMIANLDSASATGTQFPAEVTVYDSLGQSHVATVTYQQTATNTWSYSVQLPASDYSVAAGNAVPAAITGTLTFNANGDLSTVAQGAGVAKPVGTAAGDISTIPLNLTPAAVVGPPAVPGSALADGAAALTINWNLLSSAGTPNISQVDTGSAVSATTQNGYASGQYQSFSIGSDGTISATYSNGQTQNVGRLALANVTNQQGLSLLGNGDYSTTSASGTAVVATSGSSGLATLQDDALEASNVNISTEFSDLIVAQRAFEANAKSVTTFDTVTQDTINMVH
jgi:flagellar hook protein FlgE